MTRNELLGALCFPEYNFLRENEHLGRPFSNRSQPLTGAG